MPSPTCTVNHASTTGGVSLTAGATLQTIELANTSGASFWSLTCTGTDETTTPTAVNASLVVNQTTKTATFTAPAADSCAIFTSIVGVQALTKDANGVVQPSYTTTFKVYAGAEVLAANETVETDATAGWNAVNNPTIRARRYIRTYQPLGTSADAANINALLTQMAGVGEVSIGPGSAVTIAPLAIQSGTVVSFHPRSTIVSSIASAPDASYSTLYVSGVPSGAANTTLSATAASGSKTISAVASQAVGTYLFIYDSLFLQRLAIHQVIAVSGAGPYTLTLDRPTYYDFPSATTVVAPYLPARDIRIYGNGATIRGSGAGSGNGANRFLEAIRCLRVNVSDFVLDGVSGGAPAERLLSIDVPSYDCTWEDIRGEGGGVIIGASFESSYGSTMRRFAMRNCQTGFYSQDGNYCTLDDCKSTANSGPGLFIGTAGSDGDPTKGSTGIIVRGGNYSGNGTHGIQIQDGSTGTLIHGASAANNTNIAVAIMSGAWTCTGTKVVDCDLRGNGSYGVDCSSSSANTEVLGGVITGNVTGVNVQASSVGTKISATHLGTNTTGIASAADVDIMGVTATGATTLVSMTGTGTGRMRGCSLTSTAGINMVQVATGATLDVDQCQITQANGSIGIVTIGGGVCRATQVTMTGGAGGVSFYPSGATSKMMTRDCKVGVAPLVTAGAAYNGDAVLTYSASITPDAYLVDCVHIVATNGTAFTINAPTNPIQGQRLTFDIKNSSGGAHGAITWNAIFLLAGALAAIASTKRKTITFQYDGTNWVELNRAAADI